jgi:AcrR family transcriptional regulator
MGRSVANATQGAVMSISTNHVDPRVVRTHKLLREALIELIAERGYEAITVRDITERATLNRATFYLHFSDKEDLLNRGFEEIWAELTPENPFPHSPHESLSLDATHDKVRADFEHLAKYASFYRVMIGKAGVGSFVRRMQEHVQETIALRLRPAAAFRRAADPPLEIVLRFVSTAYVGLMRWWLENDMPKTPDEMADTVVQLYGMSPFEAMGLSTAGGPTEANGVGHPT